MQAYYRVRAGSQAGSQAAQAIKNTSARLAEVFFMAYLLPYSPIYWIS
jgi:hypothetical protein